MLAGDKALFSYRNKHWKSCKEARDIEKKYVRRKQHTVSFNGGSFD
jgi:hypothetical protein